MPSNKAKCSREGGRDVVLLIGFGMRVMGLLVRCLLGCSLSASRPSSSSLPTCRRTSIIRGKTASHELHYDHKIAKTWKGDE